MFNTGLHCWRFSSRRLYAVELQPKERRLLSADKIGSSSGTKSSRKRTRFVVSSGLHTNDCDNDDDPSLPDVSQLISSRF